eukprot:1158122-Pelagomonas_calceolata.AAC.4
MWWTTHGADAAHLSDAEAGRDEADDEQNGGCGVHPADIPLHHDTAFRDMHIGSMNMCSSLPCLTRAEDAAGERASYNTNRRPADLAGAPLACIKVCRLQGMHQGAFDPLCTLAQWRCM